MSDVVKQVIVIRRDLGMRRGKEIAQGAHAACAPLMDIFERWVILPGPHKVPLDLRTWMEQSYTKVTLQAESEEQLVAVYDAAKEVGLPAYMVIDIGKTEFDGVPTKTAISIGPALAEEIDKVTGPNGSNPLKLY